MLQLLARLTSQLEHQRNVDGVSGFLEGLACNASQRKLGPAGHETSHGDMVGRRTLLTRRYTPENYAHAKIGQLGCYGGLISPVKWWALQSEGCSSHRTADYVLHATA